MSRSRIISVLLGLVFVAGLLLLLYPTVSNLWNRSRATQAVASYEGALEEVGPQEYEDLLSEARAYNERVLTTSPRYVLGDPQDEEYARLLDVDGTGMMGYLQIDKIDLQLPIYHGTSDAVLGNGAGHLEGSSLPVGGEGTHAVITGHRGLPSARLFTDLDKLEEGDRFVLHVLNETLTYEVDQIRIVEPEEVEEIRPAAGEDLCTLVTCTPYGVNTHRLLVRGHRVENAAEVVVTADATRVDPLVVASVLAAVLLAGAFVTVLVRTRKKG